MATPEQPVATPQQTRPSSAATLAAAAQGTIAVTHATVTPTLVVAGVEAKAIAAATTEIVEALARFAQQRQATIIPLLNTQLAETFVNRTPAEISQLLGKELVREREFLRRQAARMKRDLPKVLGESDTTARKAAMHKLMAREQRYMGQRERAMTARAHSLVESLDLQDRSPEGAMWLLGGPVHQHTPGCLAMANKFWPWPVLREVIHPPVHPGCPCRLVGLQEAVAAGLMSADQIPDTQDALLRARRNAALEEALTDAFPAWMIADELLTLEEANEPGHDPLGHRGESAPHPVLRFAKGLVKGGQFMPKVGGSSARTKVRRLVPHVKTPKGVAGRNLGRSVWMNGNHVHVPEARNFSRKIGNHTFTSPPGSTNVYRNGKLVSTPDRPSMHPSTRRPRVGDERGKVTSAKAATPKPVLSAEDRRRQVANERVEGALRTAKTQPVRTGQNAHDAHAALRAAGFTAEEQTSGDRANLSVRYQNKGGHDLTVSYDRQTSKVRSVAWTPGKPTNTDALRRKLGMEPNEKAEPTPDKPKAPEKPAQAPEKASTPTPREPKVDRTLGTGDPVWSRQLDRAESGDGEAQWDLAAEVAARGPRSAFAEALRKVVGGGKIRRWQDGSRWPGAVPKGEAPPRYEVAHVDAAQHGPAVGVALHDTPAGGMNDRGRSLGTGRYFTSGRSGEQGTTGLSLAGAHLHRPASAQESRALSHGLSILNGIADDVGGSTLMPDPESGELRSFDLDDVLDRMPQGVDREHARDMAQYAIGVHRQGRTDEVAATHLMRGIGFDGVDNRHLPELDVPEVGSVVYAPQGVESAEPSAVASPGQGGAVVRGVLGRWVWIRGHYTHIPQDTRWEHTEDGITFTSPAGGTGVYRRDASDRDGDGLGEIVSAPGMRARHADVRNPNGSTTRRNRRDTTAPTPAPAPAPVPSPPDEGDVTPTPQPEPEPDPTPAAPDGVGAVITDDGRRALLAGERVAGITHSDTQLEPINATGLPEGILVTGAPWGRMTGEERQNALDTAYGRALAHAIGSEPTSRDDLSGLWTGGKFTDDQGNHLDRYDANQAVAAAYAQMNGEGWRDFAARYPDVSRFVMQQAQDRHFYVRPEVAEWLADPDRGSNVHDPVRELTGEARAFAARLGTMTMREARANLSNSGWSTDTYSSGTQVWRKVDTEGKQMLSITITPDPSGLNPRVLRADGTAYGFDPDATPPEGDTAEGIAYGLRGEITNDARDALTRAGWYQAGQSYLGPGHSASLWVRHDTDVAIRLLHAAGSNPETGANENRITDARPTMLGGVEQLVRARTITADRPDLGIPEGTLAGDVESIARGSNWKLGDVQQPQRGQQWVDLTRVTNRDNPDTAAVDGWRVMMAERDGQMVVTKVGRPGPDGTIAVDDAAWRSEQARQQEQLRVAATDRLSRIEGIKEMIRTATNNGALPQLAGLNELDVRFALRDLEYRQGNSRTLASGAQSSTWTNRTGSRLSVRMLDGQVHSTRLLSRGDPDEGRVRSPEGQVPTTIAKLEADLKGFSDELAGRENSRSFVTGIRWGGRIVMRNGQRGFDGQLSFGPQIRSDMETLAQARAEHRPLTDSEKRNMITSYRTMAHEVIHGVGDLRVEWFSDQGTARGVEEALTSELETEYAYELMRRHGNNDLLEYARRNGVGNGNYQVYRRNFNGLIEDMGLSQTSQPEMRDLMRDWSFRMTPPEREDHFTALVSERQGITLAAARARVIARMRGGQTVGNVNVTGFRPILTTAVPGPLPITNPAGDPPVHAIDDRVTWQGSRANGDPVPGAGRVTSIEWGQHGWTYTVAADDGTRRNFLGSLLTPEAPAPGPPVGPTVATSPLADGGRVGVGARVWGQHSRMLGTVTAIDGSQITVLRDNGSTGTFDGNSFASVTITNAGEAIQAGSPAWTPVPGGEAQRGRVVSVDWSDPQNPMVTLMPDAGTRQSIIVPGRTLTTSSPANGSGWSLPLARRDGSADHATEGTRVITSSGERVQLIGQSISTWPTGQLMFTARRDDGTILTTPREGIVGFAGELPRLGRPSADVTDYARQVAEKHYERQDAGIAATRVGEWLSANAAEGFGQWATEQGIDLGPYTPSRYLMNAYEAGFSSKGMHDAFVRASPRGFAGVMQLAREAGLPTPDWENRVRPGGVVIPPGDITNEDVLRALYSGTFGRAGHTSAVTSVVSSTNGATIQGDVKDASGNVVGEFNRRVTRNVDGSFGVYNAYLRLNNDAQGTGFASEFNRHCFAAYRERGVREVTVSANLDVGGYTWAATGFDFNIRGETDQQRIAEARAAMAYSFVREALENRSITQAEYDSVKDRLWNSRGPLLPTHVQHAYDLAHIDGRPSGRRGTKNIGQKVLLDRSWPGIRLMGQPDPRPGTPTPPAPEPPVRRTRRPSAAIRARTEELSQRIEAVSDRVRLNAPSFPVRRRMVTGGEVSLDNQQVVADFIEHSRNLHPGVDVPRVSVSEGSLAAIGRGVLGAHIGQLGQIMFARRRSGSLGAASADMVFAHEYGHHIDHHILQRLGPTDPGWAELREVYQAVAATGMSTRLRTAAARSLVSRRWATYALQKNEVWARAYARYAAERNGYERIRTQADRIVGEHGEWTAEEFASVAVAMDRLFAALGTPRTT